MLYFACKGKYFLIYVLVEENESTVAKIFFVSFVIGFYVHDPNLLYSNLSISISYGIGISVSGGNCDIFSAETLTFMALE